MQVRSRVTELLLPVFRAGLCGALSLALAPAFGAQLQFESLAKRHLPRVFDRSTRGRFRRRGR